jgi:tetratricopeptide (TPR) repeat protein
MLSKVAMKRPSRTALLSLAALLLFAAPIPTATAQGDLPANEETAKQVERLYAEGAALYKDQKYRAAIDKWNEAYRAYPEPNLLYNIGRAHEALGEIDVAISHFERCVVGDGVAPSVRQKSLDRLKDLEKAKANSTKTAAETQTANTNTSTPPPQSPPPPAKSDALAVTKWVTTGVAGGLLVTGAIFYGIGASDHADLEDAIASAGSAGASLTQREARQRQEDGEFNKTLGVSLLSGGAALGAVATLLFILDLDSSVEVSVSPQKEGTLLLLGGHF